MSEDASGLLGPGGEPLSSPAKQAGTGPDAGSGSEPPPGGAGGPAFRISVVLAVDPRLLPGTLVTLLPADPMQGYRERIETARPDFEKTGELAISALVPQMHAKGAGVKDLEAAATAVVEQQFMGSLWDMAYHQVSGGNVVLVFSAGLSPPDGFAGARIAADYDVPRLWVTSRAVTVADRFGVWAVPVDRDGPMPATVGLTAENFQPLRMRFAKVKV